MEKHELPLIILLGGSSGSGKTTLANALVHELGLAHHLSTGFIREAVSAILPIEEAALLNNFTFDAWKLIPELVGLPKETVLTGAIAQTQLLKPAIDACINRSIREGASLVIEGTHLLPGMFDPTIQGITSFCILDVPDRSILIQRAMGPTHKKRNLDQIQLNSIVELQEAYVRLGKEYELPIIVNTNLQQSVNQVKALIEANLRN